MHGPLPNTPNPAPLDSAQSVRSVREDTAELATYFLSDKKDNREPPFLRRSRSTSSAGVRYTADHHRGADASPVRPAETITEVPEPPSPPTEEPTVEGPSMLANMFRRSPPGNSYFYSPREGQGHEDLFPAEESGSEDEATLSKIPTAEPHPLLARTETAEEASETSPLLTARSRDGQRGGDGIYSQGNGHGIDMEGQKLPSRKRWFGGTRDSLRDVGSQVASIIPIIGNPKRWDGRMLWQSAVIAPVACLPAVVVGLLLNILDALSYGELQ